MLTLVSAPFAQLWRERIVRALPPLIAVAILIYAMLFYMNTYQPELMDTILIQVDVFGITRVAGQEQAREDKIKNLSIPYEEKQVLFNRTVFMGATCDMVKLALGEPKKVVEQMWDAKKTMLTYYIYYLPNDHRPTILVFDDDKLIKAYKGSALDVGN
jgi:hypothetical protein